MDDGTATIRGLTTGCDTDYPWSDWPTGLLDTAPIRIDDVSIPLRDGVVAGDDYAAGRDIAFSVSIRAHTVAEGEAKLAALTAAYAPSRVDLPLDVRVAGTPGEYRYYGRPRGVSVAMSRPRVAFGRGGMIDARCQFTATDPVRYSAVEDTIEIGLGDPGEGLVFPAVFPVVFGTAGTGLGSAVNAGSAEVSSWRATLIGPLINPRLTHVESGRFVGLTATIATGQTVVLDGQSAAILFAGTSPRPSWRAPGSSWFRLQPGVNGLRLTADAGTGVCDFVWRSGWA